MSQGSSPSFRAIFHLQTSSIPLIPLPPCCCWHQSHMSTQTSKLQTHSSNYVVNILNGCFLQQLTRKDLPLSPELALFPFPLPHLPSHPNQKPRDHLWLFLCCTPKYYPSQVPVLDSAYLPCCCLVSSSIAGTGPSPPIFVASNPSSRK